MPKIIPIRDLRQTSALFEMCRQENEPVFITKNGYGSMVLMTMETYERNMAASDIYAKLMEAKTQDDAGMVSDAGDALRKLRDTSHPLLREGV
ncbi:MAG: type II toxin-antitoxin system Phd/YefM family antitoxin [Oscillospiraceae bacterium]|jgi:PHD/YefM family antitoxin component YafN of YafNO toxin-antitoxin module|nr:type II toxin-antitoxin system Phd/YefM family antitoxin [Oscillospiraceae bacterium]